MTLQTRPTLALALSLTLATPLAADVTGAEVWASWKQHLTDLGTSIEATEAQSGGVLTVSGITFSFSSSDPQTTAQLEMDAVTFTDKGDGTVDIRFPQEMPMSFLATAPDQGSASGTGKIVHDQLTLVASGDVGNLRYDYQAPSMSIVLDDFQAQSESGAPDAVNMRADILNIVGTTTTVDGETREISQEVNADTLTMNAQFSSERATGETGSASATVSGIGITSSAIVPKGIDPENMDDLLEAGLSVSNQMSFVSGQSMTTSTNRFGTSSFGGSTDSGTIDTAMNGHGLTYKVNYANTNLTAQVPQFPFPIELNGAQANVDVAMPVLPSETPQDFAFVLGLQDFTISDSIWNVFDPTAQLPRGPAQLVLDVGGKARRLPGQGGTFAQMANQNAPGEIHALDINKLNLSAAGVDLSGVGGFIFDNDDTKTFDGFPKPQGGIELTLTGGNAMLDKLVQIGLLPTQQAMLARMFMGMFGVPVGDDVLTTKLEITPEGEFTANGAPLQ